MATADGNRLILCGTAAGAPAFSHAAHGTAFFCVPLIVPRRSGTADRLPVIVPERRLPPGLMEGGRLRVQAQLDHGAGHFRRRVKAARLHGEQHLRLRVVVHGVAHRARGARARLRAQALRASALQRMTGRKSLRPNGCSQQSSTSAISRPSGVTR